MRWGQGSQSTRRDAMRTLPIGHPPPLGRPSHLSESAPLACTKSGVSSFRSDMPQLTAPLSSRRAVLQPFAVTAGETTSLAPSPLTHRLLSPATQPA